uniref:Avr-Pita1 protein (Effector protein AVR-Pita1) n=1 Tax=Ganoderma boninense TaxID=34458 RepID=A0A5K1JX85_9APHY|nr:Avr-Pita1 protein (Effector protein AVR-Pita1) [Ganoderma boninense]
MSSAYPHLLAALMRTFRDKYRDPHLALAMFDHARNLSIASFVFGCTTPAYNELIETRWWCFRDLRGVVEALDEMRVNGIAVDGRTRQLTETVRREVGERTMWQEESSLGSGEVWEMVTRIEQLTAESVSEGKKKRKTSKTDVEAKTKGSAKERAWKPRKWSAGQEMWKKDALDANARDGWAFDKWQLQRPAAAAKRRPLRL